MKWTDIFGRAESQNSMANYEHRVLGATVTNSGTGDGLTYTTYPPSADDLQRAASQIQAMYGQQAHVRVEKRLPTLTLSMLSGEAGRASLDELRDLWSARWGDKWVKRDEIDGDFFEVAAVRLISANKLETHSLGDGITVYRLL